MRDLGDRSEDSSIDFCFNTFNYRGFPRTLDSISSVTDPSVAVYKPAAAGSSAIKTTVGVALEIDFDSVQGLNHVLIDTSADAFYVTGEDYIVVLANGAVGGTSLVGKVLATFSIENRYHGAGGDATAANQTTILNHLTDMKGAGWTSTDTLENIYDDSNELQTDWADGGRLDVILDGAGGGGGTTNITTETTVIETD